MCKACIKEGEHGLRLNACQTYGRDMHEKKKALGIKSETLYGSMTAGSCVTAMMMVCITSES